LREFGRAICFHEARSVSIILKLGQPLGKLKTSHVQGGFNRFEDFAHRPYAGKLAEAFFNEEHGHMKAIDSLAPARLKLVRFPARSRLPIAALPSVSLFPKAPFDLSVCPSMSLASPRLHSSGGERMN
jgi:hypothetical protein